MASLGDGFVYCVNQTIYVVICLHGYPTVILTSLAPCYGMLVYVSHVLNATIVKVIEIKN